MNMIGYHVDRKRTLTPSVISSLGHMYSTDMFPEGLSVHGRRYHCLSNFYSLEPVLIEKNLEQFKKFYFPLWSSYAIEVSYEFVRRYEFPDKPSRFQSFFAFENIDSARNFCSKNCSVYSEKFGSTDFPIYLRNPCCECPIYEVKFDPSKAHFGDMNLLTGHHLSELIVNARRYWKGEHGHNPFIEILIPVPFKVLDPNREGGFQTYL